MAISNISENTDRSPVWMVIFGINCKTPCYRYVSSDDENKNVKLLYSPVVFGPSLTPSQLQVSGFFFLKGCTIYAHTTAYLPGDHELGL